MSFLGQMKGAAAVSLCVTAPVASDVPIGEDAAKVALATCVEAGDLRSCIGFGTEHCSRTTWMVEFTNHCERGELQFWEARLRDAYERSGGDPEADLSAFVATRDAECSTERQVTRRSGYPLLFCEFESTALRVIELEEMLESAQ